MSSVSVVLGSVVDTSESSYHCALLYNYWKGLYIYVEEYSTRLFSITSSISELHVALNYRVVELNLSV